MDTKPASDLADLIERIAQRDQLGLAELYDRTTLLALSPPKR
jgi:hypothetical protein